MVSFVFIKCTAFIGYGRKALVLNGECLPIEETVANLIVHFSL
jgi:hypothetical protein